MSAGAHLGRACGKAILLGEHAVVYGVPAIALGLDRGATAEAAPAEASSVSLALADGRVVIGAGDDDLSLAAGRLLAASRCAAPVRLSLRTDLPPAAGLGCSAALGVAAARAVDAMLGGAASDDDIAERALAWESVFHGNPSGIDTAAAARGGCLTFTRSPNGGARIEPVEVPIPMALAIGHTGVSSSTRAMVEGVARTRERHPAMVEKTFAAITSLVRNAVLAIEAGDWFALGRLLDLNQMLLAGLMLSTEETELMCGLARGAGALGAKLTGAGGGGCVIALARDDAGPILDAWRTAGFAGFATTVGGVPSSPEPAGGAAPR